MPDIIQQLLDLKEWSQNPERYERRMNFRGGQLVQPGPGRQGYKGNYIYTDQQGKIVDYTSRRFNVLSKKWEYKGQTTVDGKKTSKWFVQKKGESKPQFFNRMEDVVTKKLTKSGKLMSATTAEGRAYIDNWTTNWFDDNMGKYEIKEFDKMANNIAEAWKSHLKDVDLPKGFLRQMTTPSGFPNVTTGITYQPFTYEGFSTHTTGVKGESVFKTMFLRNKVRTTQGLKNKFKEYFDFISMDKRGLYRKGIVPTRKAFEEILDKDVIYLLSQDSELYGPARHQLFNSLGDDFSKSYSAFQKKLDVGKYWQKHANIIEEKLGLTKHSIRNNMRAEGRALKKIFNVSSLKGTGLEYSIEHSQGLAAAARSGDKKLMELAVNDLIGSTKAQNQAAGFYGFEANRGALIREINAGRNVKSNLKSLNEMTQTTYKDLGIKRNIYSVKDGQLVSKSISPALTQEQRFGQYFKTISKTKEGAAALTKQKATNTQLADLLKKHKLLTGKPLPPSLGGISFGGVKGIDDFMTSGKFKGLRNLLKGEGFFVLLDYVNNLTKGQKSQKALGKAIEVASFEAIDLDADERALERYLIERGGYSETEIIAMKDYLNYMKKFKTYERAYKMLNYAKEHLGESTGEAEDIGTTWDDVTDAAQNLKLRENELRDLQATYEEGTTNMRLGKDILTKAMHGLAAQEWNKPAGTWLDRGSRTKQGEGAVWNPIGALTRDIGGLFSGKMPTEFYEATIGKFPSLLDPRIKEKEKQKIIMEHPVYGFEEEFKKPEFQGALEDVQFDMGYALAGGGIAGIRRPNAIPPESGPEPQGGGLSTMFNRVKPW